MKRCSWVNDDPLYQDYHDNEWGIVQKDSLKLFEQLCLESMQSGLSWYTILKKREGYRQAFMNFNPYEIIKFTDEDVERLMHNEAIIRHRAKIKAMITNAKAYLAYEAQYGKDSFSDFIWRFTYHKTIKLDTQVTMTDRSKALSNALKKLGFKFIGPTTIYAFMQAVGMYHGHETQCQFYKD